MKIMDTWKTSTHIFICLIVLNIGCSFAVSLPCSPKDFGGESFVCVCNATFCDTTEPIVSPQSGTYLLYRSSKAGERLSLSHGKITSTPSTKVILTLNKSTTYQDIIGFGGAFTDAAGINILSLSEKTQDNLLKSYYTTDGIEYNVGRIPMASCDFSTHPYSYDDQAGDLSLSKFSLTSEDTKYKIPIIQRAMKMNSRNLTIFGSPWSAPAWMKTNNNMTGKGTLIGQPGGKYYKAWAMYFIRFIQEYEKQGVKIWGITGQNEPSDGKIKNFRFQAMGWTAATQRDFIALDLGPALEKYGYGHVKLMILDDARFLLPYWAEQVFQSANASKYISGIAVHWYEDFVTPSVALSSTHKMFPDKFILATEACEGSYPWDIKKVDLGSWMRAERYAHDIIQAIVKTMCPEVFGTNLVNYLPEAEGRGQIIHQDLNNWVTGWTDWNIALDKEGGPNWVKNFVDSPIIVDASKDEFYKQPMFYALGHFSKFIVPGSKRIEIQGPDLSRDHIEVTAFIRPDNLIVCVLLYSGFEDGEVSFYLPDVGYVNVFFPARSMQTVIFNSVKS